MLAQGEKVMQFEKRFAQIHEVHHGIALNSGTSALHICLLSLNLKEGDEVIVPAISFAATANSVVMAGGVPVFADIDAETMNICVQDLERKITTRTKAVIPVHLYGSMADMPEIQRLAAKRGIFVLEDAAQAHGASLNGKSPGFFGDAAAFSFYATKNISTGEGGLILTKSLRLDSYIREVRNQGMKGTYEYVRAGLNNRMTDIQAAIGLVQLDRLEKLNEKRRSHAALYEALLPQEVQRQKILEKSVSSYHQYTILVPGGKRDLLKRRLEEAGIPTRVFYPQALNKLPHFGEASGLPNAEQFVQNCLSLPVGPHLTQKQIRLVSNKIERFLGDFVS